jgi:glycosyltransferase involved in cell wall biosynthesis
VVSVIVPAHDEAAVIARLLHKLLPSGPQDGLEVLVVCNGCTDDTAAVAAAVPGVRVLQTPVPSKAEALRLGNEAATSFPRVYVDADVEIDRAGVLRLVRELEEPGVLVAGPRRRLPRDRMSLPVRWYYDVWQALPQVAGGIFGRGVIAMSEDGFKRIAALPSLMSDDLAMSAAFAPEERRIVDGAEVTVHPPRTWSDLMRRRTRAVTGTRQLYEGAGPDGRPAEWKSDSRTSKADLIGMVRRDPALAVKMPVFLAVAVLAKRRAARAVARGDYDTWLRDESSRQA